jgi:dolichol-phosphate mannosyltransferase
MASDLQDPPELIPEMIARANEGFDQVLVRVTKRATVPFLYRKLSSCFYFLANKMTNGMMHRNVSDFRLLTRKSYESVRQLREQNRFLRGLVAWTGFASDVIEIERPPRFGGESKFLKFGLRKAIHWGLKAILAHTTAPLVWISILGLASSSISFLMTIIFSIVWLTLGVPFAGFGTIVGVITLGLSLILMSLGIIAQYLALIYDEVKQRPLYLISEKTYTI